jgi:hypothetical protein
MKGASVGSSCRYITGVVGQLYILKLCRKQAEVTQNHENANVRSIGQGEPRHRKCKRLKRGGGQAYDRSSDETAIVARATNNRAFSAVLSPN